MLYTISVSISFCLGFSHAEADQPTGQLSIFPEIDLRTEEFRRLNLSLVRMYLEMLPRAAEFSEEAADFADRNNMPEKALKYRENALKARLEELKYKKRERELWEQQPGGITAPPPRPVKRK